MESSLNPFLFKKDTKFDTGVESAQLGTSAVGNNGTIVKSESDLNETDTTDLLLAVQSAQKTVPKIEPKDLLVEFKADITDDQLDLKPDIKHCIDEGVHRSCVTCYDCRRNFPTKDDIERHVTDGVCGGVTCDTCWKGFPSKAELLEHYQFSCLLFRLHGGRPNAPVRTGRFVCLECGCRRKTISSLVIHEATHQLKTCDHCNKEFVNKARLARHMESHWPRDVPRVQALYRCEICQISFRNSCSLAPHRKGHEGKDPYDCRICEETFFTRQKKSLHMRVHKGLEPISCEICGKNFSYPSLLKSHAITHMEVKPFKCEICCKSFKMYKSMKDHKVKVHKNPKRYRPTCEVCGKTFGCEGGLNRHSRFHSTEFPCKICGAKYRTTKALAIHLKNAHETRNHKCDDCWKIFLSKSDLSNHVKIHLEYKPYKCEICGKSFRFLKYKTVHSRTHLDNTRFECNFCGKKFKCKTGADNHKRTHTGEKPFGCELCDMKFASVNSRSRHRIGHRRNFLFKCKECGEHFETELKLSRHATSHVTKIKVHAKRAP